MMKRTFQIWNNIEPIFKYFSGNLYKEVNGVIRDVKNTAHEIYLANKKSELSFINESTESDEERTPKKNFIVTLLDPKNNFSQHEIVDEISTFIIAVSFFLKMFHNLFFFNIFQPLDHKKLLYDN